MKTVGFLFVKDQQIILKDVSRAELISVMRSVAAGKAHSPKELHHGYFGN